jgi:hypothetical protein
MEQSPYFRSLFASLFSAEYASESYSHDLQSLDLLPLVVAYLRPLTAATPLSLDEAAFVSLLHATFWSLLVDKMTDARHFQSLYLPLIAHYTLCSFACSTVTDPKTIETSRLKYCHCSPGSINHPPPCCQNL